MILRIHPDNPEGRKISEAVNILEKGGVVIIPTDSVYAFACDPRKAKAQMKIAQLKGIKFEKAKFSLICNSISQINEFIKPMSNPVFKLVKQCLPGPFTFIFQSNTETGRRMKQNKKEIGIRYTENKIVNAIIEELDYPLTVSSVHHDDEILEYQSDPVDIYDEWGKRVDLVIDGGFGSTEVSTIFRATEENPELIRAGKGYTDDLI